MLTLTQQKIEMLEEDCKRITTQDKSGAVESGFMKIDFADYSKVINDFQERYPQIEFELTSFGIKANLIEA